MFIVQVQTPGAEASLTPRTELSRSQLSKNRLGGAAHVVVKCSCWAPRDEAIRELSGLLQAAKGQTGDPHVLGVSCCPEPPGGQSPSFPHLGGWGVRALGPTSCFPSH